VLGFNIDYSHSKYSEPGSSASGNGFGAGIFLRKYRLLGNGFYLFGETSLNGSYGHQAADEPAGNEPYSNTTNTYQFNLRFFPGVAFALNPKWQIEAGLPSFFQIAYSHSKQTEKFTTGSDQYYISRGFVVQSSLTGNSTLSVGVRYFIGG
jgi:hypothetical protein